MEKKVSKHNEKEKPNWDWTHVECYLKTVEANRKSTIWNLTPSIILTNPSTEAAGPNVRLYIDTEKSLQYSNDLEWNWHKSWNIPNISLRLQIKDETTGDFLLSPRNLYAQIFAVKKNTQNEKTDRMTLIDVGIRGQSKMEMIDGQVYFSAIKFSSTTYNNQGINFNLLIVLYINQGQFEKPKVLTAVMSPPIFVDSRRSARDYQQKKFSSFVEPFGYDNIQKEFIKRENKSKCQSEIVIKNDPQGFYNYITAPNIRHKVKHPVFLAIKFSNCVKIYYNTKLVTTNNINELLENMQTKLLKQNKSKQKTDVELPTNLEEKHFVFVISNLNDSLKRKKVLQSIETMQNQFIGITCGSEDLIDCLMPIGTIQSVKKAYKQTYESLITICQNYEPEYQQESEDQYYSEQYDDSQKQSVKKKQKVQPKAKSKPTIISGKNQSSVPQKPLKSQKNEQIILKKEELFDSQFQPAVFFNHDQQNIRRNNAVASSAFNKAVGFRNVGNPSQNNPIFDTTHLNKAFSNNLGNIDFDHKQSNNTSGLELKNPGFKSAGKNEGNMLPGQNNQMMSQQGMNTSMQGLGSSMSQGQGMGNSFGLNSGIGGNGFNNSLYDNLMYSNLTLGNWLNSVKNNNNSLYDGMMNTSLSDQMMHKNNLERYLQTEQQQKMLELGRMPLQTEEQQSILCLIQQISLYKQLLSQVTYQNQLLSRDITFKQQQQSAMQQHNAMGQYGGMQGMNYLSGLGGMNMGNMNSLGNMGNLNGMNNNGMNNLNNLSSLSGVSQGLLGNNLLNNQMNLVNNLLLNQGNRPGEQQSKQKQGNSSNLSQVVNNNLNQGMTNNLSQSMFSLNQGIGSGLNQGLTTGMNQGLTSGLTQGLTSGLNQGLASGLNRGLADGLNSSLMQGLNSSLNQGMTANLNQSLGGQSLGNPGLGNQGLNLGNQALGNQSLGALPLNNQVLSSQSMSSLTQVLGSNNNQIPSGNNIQSVNSSLSQNIGLGGNQSMIPNINQPTQQNVSPGTSGVEGTVGAPSITKQSLSISPSNYQIIKNMVLQQMKREAELKERERQQSSK